jgi:hypothetical protein
MLAMMRIWLTNKAVFHALRALARSLEGVPGRVPVEERQRFNMIFWYNYDKSGGWRR